MTARLRVAVVAPSLAIVGGQAVQAAQLLDRWSGDPDVEAWLVPINPAPPRWLAGAARVKYARTLLTQVIYWPLLLRELRRADLVHVFSASHSSFLLAPMPAIAMAGVLGRPVLLNYHSGEAPDHLRQSALARAVLGRVPSNIVPSRFLVDVFESFGIAAEAIPNIVDRERYRHRRRRRLRPRLLSTRNLEPNYNVACTVRAFARVRAQHPDATLTVVGSGADEPALRALVRGLALEGVTFAGRVAPSDMWRYYDEADLYVQTPVVDNMPLSVLEAFASGLPVVSTDAGGVSAMLTPGAHGLLAPIDDDKEVAACVLRLLDDPELACRMADAAYRAIGAFEWKNVRGRWLSAYRRLAPTTGRLATAGRPL